LGLGAGVFEQYVATTENIPIEIIMPTNQILSLKDAIESGNIVTVKESLAAIDVENAEASDKADETKVKEFIEKDIGFENMNNAVAKCMHEWCGRAMFK
jgi:hypothetical protein